MDSERFDTFVRGWATGATSRRAIVTRVAAGLAGGGLLLLNRAEEAAAKNKKGVGQPCRKAEQCASGFCCCDFATSQMVCLEIFKFCGPC
jgi:hypothetical protein